MRAARFVSIRPRRIRRSSINWARPAASYSWQGVKIRMFKGPGLKSQIKGTDVYAVIIAKRGTPMEVEGFMGEALVLEATAMGLGTCWLGAGFYSGYHRSQRRFADGRGRALRYFHW